KCRPLMRPKTRSCTQLFTRLSCIAHDSSQTRPPAGRSRGPNDGANEMSVDMQVTTEEHRRLLSARIADEIRSAVLSGEMRPGMRIRQELLAAKFGASRIPVREALKQLENEGLVVLAPNRGAWIADVNSEESIEVYKIREAVEPLAIGESVPNLTDEDVETLDRIVRELEHVTTLEEY